MLALMAATATAAVTAMIVPDKLEWINSTAMGMQLWLVMSLSIGMWLWLVEEFGHEGQSGDIAVVSFISFDRVLNIVCQGRK